MYIKIRVARLCNSFRTLYTKPNAFINPHKNRQKFTIYQCLYYNRFTLQYVFAVGLPSQLETSLLWWNNFRRRVALENIKIRQTSLDNPIKTTLKIINAYEYICMYIYL